MGIAPHGNLVYSCAFSGCGRLAAALVVEGARLDDVQDAQVPREEGRRERQVCNTFQAASAMMKT